MKKNFLLTTLILIMMFILFACINSTMQQSNANVQKWTGNLTGMAVGEIEMKSWDIKSPKGEHKTKSKMSVKICGTADGHTGTMEGIMTGLITGKKFKGDFIGNAIVVAGDSPVRGIFVGEFTDTKGSGTWIISADRSSLKYTGKWELQKE